MTSDKRDRLKRAGWDVGDYRRFLGPKCKHCGQPERIRSHGYGLKPGEIATIHVFEPEEVMTDDELAAIEARHAIRDCSPKRYGCDFDDHYICVIHSTPEQRLSDIDALVAEVRRLREEADSWENAYTEHMEQCS